jgi:serine/threonine protein kinase
MRRAEAGGWRGFKPSDVRAAIFAQDVHWEGEPWHRVSTECIAFISALLDRDPAARPTAFQAVKHPWFRVQVSQLVGFCQSSASVLAPYSRQSSPWV